MASKITSQEHLAMKGEVKLFVFRKFKDTPTGKPVLVLVHGSSLCALPSYDLRVPGRESEYSMMDICAERGYDVWTIDHRAMGSLHALRAIPISRWRSMISAPCCRS